MIARSRIAISDALAGVTLGPRGRLDRAHRLAVGRRVEWQQVAKRRRDLVDRLLDRLGARLGSLQQRLEAVGGRRDGPWCCCALAIREDLGERERGLGGLSGGSLRLFHDAV